MLVSTLVPSLLFLFLFHRSLSFESFLSIIRSVVYFITTFAPVHFIACLVALRHSHLCPEMHATTKLTKFRHECVVFVEFAAFAVPSSRANLSNVRLWRNFAKFIFVEFAAFAVPSSRAKSLKRSTLGKFRQIRHFVHFWTYLAIAQSIALASFAHSLSLAYLFGSIAHLHVIAYFVATSITLLRLFGIAHRITFPRTA